MVQLVRHAAFTSHTTTRGRVCAHQIIPISRQRRAELFSPRTWQRCRATAPNQPAPQGAAAPEEEFVGIPPEEDVEVPGNYLDALDSKTKLGKAVRAAVDELNHLNAMEMETLKQCDDLLKKLGIKSSILQAPAAPQEAAEDEQ